MSLITLDNGLRIFTLKRDDLRSATLGIWVASGSVNETEQNNGISHFIEHIVLKIVMMRKAVLFFGLVTIMASRWLILMIQRLVLMICFQVLHQS